MLGTSRRPSGGATEERLGSEEPVLAAVFMADGQRKQEVEELLGAREAWGRGGETALVELEGERKTGTARGGGLLVVANDND